MKPVLVLYYSRHGSTRKLADAIAQGVISTGAEVWVRTVKPLNEGDGHAQDNANLAAPVVTDEELVQCSALALGSPTRFGNMAAPMKYFLDGTSSHWLKGSLINKPACVFTSSSSMHGGQESTLLSMMLPLMHHGMLMCGLPYSEPALHDTRSGGTPYGVTHVAMHNNTQLSDDEKTLCLAQGRRLAQLAKSLTQHLPENAHGA